MTAGLLVALLLLAPPQTPDEMSDAAQRLAMAKRYEEAAALWKKALTIDPKHFPSLFNLGFLYYSTGKLREAEGVLSRAAKIAPDDFNTRYLLGNTLVGLGKREAGLLEWKAALVIRPQNLKLMQVMAVEYGKGSYFRDACEISRKAVEAGGQELNGYLIAIKYCDDASDASAIELARQAVEKFPASARANFEYGFQLKRNGRREESISYLKKAMAADPQYEEPFFFYGDLLLEDEQYEEATRHLQVALRLRPDYIAACVSLAKALMGLEKSREAVDVLNGCISKNPKHPQPHLLLSQVWFRLGDEEKAAAAKETSLRLRRENPSIMEGAVSRPFPSAVRRP